MLQQLGQKVREASLNRVKKLQEEKQAATERKPRGRSAEVPSLRGHRKFLVILGMYQNIDL